MSLVRLSFQVSKKKTFLSEPSLVIPSSLLGGPNLKFPRSFLTPILIMVRVIIFVLILWKFCRHQLAVGRRKYLPCVRPLIHSGQHRGTSSAARERPVTNWKVLDMTRILDLRFGMDLVQGNSHLPHFKYVFIGKRAVLNIR